MIRVEAVRVQQRETHHRQIALGTYTEDRRMRKINSVQHRLEWVQPRALKMYYELRSDNELIATLGFRSLLGSFATAESAEGCWTFKRTGFLDASDDSRLRVGRRDRDI